MGDFFLFCIFQYCSLQRDRSAEYTCKMIKIINMLQMKAEIKPLLILSTICNLLPLVCWDRFLMKMLESFSLMTLTWTQGEAQKKTRLKSFHVLILLSWKNVALIVELDLTPGSKTFKKKFLPNSTSYFSFSVRRKSNKMYWKCI